ncbi:class I SAM-dependent methyltransferase [Nocardioides sp. T2.26MG-1]|uniref:class I SAM-dependent methyltransferase n=1 Tax=Nocardioides sp. T2.26MG-1 TaxID=3041166 RepID=UPI002540B706|nr:class I SAM-dependent methyltransferase [Nocardioides sp. T2.26MG-1]
MGASECRFHQPSGRDFFSCGQGTQAIELARRGCRVTGVNPSARLLAQMIEQARFAGCTVEALQGRLEDIDAVVGDRTFDLVCARCR